MMELWLYDPMVVGETSITPAAERRAEQIDGIVSCIPVRKPHWGCFEPIIKIIRLPEEPTV